MGKFAPSDSTPPPPNPDGDPYIGRVLGDRYLVLELLAEGGMARVYAARHTVIKRRVAVKILKPALAKEEPTVRRFLNEGRAAGTIGHPNIVESLDMGHAHDDAPYLVLEYLEGTNLALEIMRERFAPGRAAHVAAQIASAVAAAHAAGILHRDIKPENVFLTVKGGKPDHVKVLDFGIAKQMGRPKDIADTKSGMVVGTPQFMAPEQVTNRRELDERVDVYGAGATLYAMLAGFGPFEHETFPRIFHAVVEEGPQPLKAVREDLPDALVAVVEKAMAKSPEDRYRTMTELEEALRPLAVEPAVVRGVPPAPTSQPRVQADASGSNRAVRPKGASSAPHAAALTQSARPPGARMRSRVAIGFGVIALAGGVWTLANVRSPRIAPGAPSSATSADAPLAKGTTTSAPEAPSSARADAIVLDVRASAPGARVVVRGATHDLPFKGALHVGTDPELVEVSAPGRKGRRFWLALDQERHLFVDLRPGNGTSDATAAETAIALGDAVAAGDVPAGSDRPGSVNAKRAPATAGPSRSDAPAPPSSDSPSAGSSPVASAAPAVASAPPSPAVPQSASIAAPVASPALQPAPVAAAPVAPPPGTIATHDVNATVRAHAGEIRECFQRARIESQDAHGRITVRATVSPSGAVTGASIASSDSNSSRLEACVVEAFRRWTFPSPSGGVSGVVSYTFDLQ